MDGGSWLMEFFGILRGAQDDSNSSGGTASSEEV